MREKCHETLETSQAFTYDKKKADLVTKSICLNSIDMSTVQVPTICDLTADLPLEDNKRFKGVVLRPLQLSQLEKVLKMKKNSNPNATNEDQVAVCMKQLR